MRRLALAVVLAMLLLAVSVTAASAAVIKDFTFVPQDHAVDITFTAEGYDSAVVSWTNSLEKGTMIVNLTLEEAIELIKNSKTKNVLCSYPEKENIKVMNGRYGAYITNGEDNFKIPKGTVAENLSLAECLDIIANTAPTAKKKTFRKKK